MISYVNRLKYLIRTLIIGLALALFLGGGVSGYYYYQSNQSMRLFMELAGFTQEVVTQLSQCIEHREPLPENGSAL